MATLPTRNVPVRFACKKLAPHIIIKRKMKSRISEFLLEIQWYSFQIALTLVFLVTLFKLIKNLL